jgi:succinoglycan biosynthesis transport protein ExoP
MTTAAFLRSLRLYWYVAFVGLLLGGFCGLVVHSVLPKKYEASSLLLLSAPSIANPSDGSTYIQNRMPTYAALITSRPVLDSAWRSLGTDEVASRSRDTVSANVEASTALIALSAQAPDPTSAADLANAVSRSYVALAPHLDNVSRPVLHVDIVEGAEPPLAPSGPSAPIAVLMGDILGLTAGVLVTAVRGASATARMTGSGTRESTDRTDNALYVR